MAKDPELSDEQAAKIRDAALKRALSTPHKPHKPKGKPKKKSAKKNRAAHNP